MDNVSGGEMRSRIVVRTWIGLAVAGAVTIGLSPKAAAATATANLSLSASVANNCTISTSAVAFGSYDPVVANAAANLDGSGQVTIACTKGAAPTIGLGLGSNASGSVRRLGDGSGNYLSYEVYSDSSRSVVWGDSGSNLLTPAVAPSKAARNFTVYGRIVANQDVAAGSYSDTVVATVNF
jgi:spore coat protein U-like protein